MKTTLIAIMVLVLGSVNAHAFLSRGYNIEQLSQKADRIFMGEVTGVTESAPNSTDYPYVEIQFKVFESFKGDVPSIFSFRQFAPKVGKQYEMLGMSKKSYSIGEKLVMFLGNPGSKGFSIPIDLQLFALQTKSDRQTDLDKAIILNKQLGERYSGHLFHNLQNPNTLRTMDKITKGKRSGGIRFQDFRELIQASIQ